MGRFLDFGVRLGDSTLQNHATKTQKESLSPRGKLRTKSCQIMGSIKAIRILEALHIGVMINMFYLGK